MVDPYHRAARDNNIDELRTATKRDTNRKDEDGMTPVHYAASCGNVEALRLLVGKGGEPDKPNYDGATAVHLAASCGQLNCLSFLTNFGCNIWALNNDGRTPLEDAAYHGRMECVRHLDGLIAIEMLRDKKGVEKQKLHAKREAIKRVKKQSRLQQERDKAYEKRVKEQVKHQYDQLGNGNVGEQDDNWAMASISNGRSRTFSELAGGKRFEENDDEWEPRNTTSHVYSDTYSQRSNLFKALKGKINDTLRRKKAPTNGLDSVSKRSSLSQPDLIFKTGPMVSSKSLDDFGEVDEGSSDVRVRSVSMKSDGSDSDHENATLGRIVKKYDDEGNVSTEIMYQSVSSKSNGSMRSQVSHTSESSRKSSTSRDHDHDLASLQSAGFEDLNYSAETEVSDEMKAVVTFLSGLNLDQFSSSFLKESIDLNALILCNDKDLQELGLPLGPRRKILEAVKRRKLALKSPGIMADSKI